MAKKKVEAVEVAPTIPMTMTPREIAEVIKAKFVAAATEVANDAHGESVAMEIINDLNAQKRAVTLRLLGLDDKWGKWEVDHCNGRESPITEYLVKESEGAIRKWVNEAVQETLTTEFQAKVMRDAKAAIKKEVMNQVDTALEGYRLGQMAKPIIEGLFQQAANEVREELGLEKKHGENDAD